MFGRMMATPLIGPDAGKDLEVAVAELLVATDYPQIARWIQFPTAAVLLLALTQQAWVFDEPQKAALLTHDMRRPCVRSLRRLVVASGLEQTGAPTRSRRHAPTQKPAGTTTTARRRAGTVRQLREAKAATRIYFDDPNNWINQRPEVSQEERAKFAELQAELMVPLFTKDRLLGFISLSQKRSEEPYSGTDLRLLESVAVQTGLALDNARLTAAIAEEAAQREALRQEVEIAREVQERLFPQQLPAVPGLDYYGTCRLARGVGGDYYDFLLLPDGRLGIAIGDVSGKGISAALMMASLQASLRGQIMLAPCNLAELMSRVNRLVYEASWANRYATFFFAA